MNLINLNAPVGIQIDGFSDGAWATIATSRAELETEGKTPDEVWQMLDEALDQFNDIINQAYKDNNTGYVQLGNTSLSILDFRAIRVYYVQSGKRVSLDEKDAEFEQ